MIGAKSLRIKLDKVDGLIRVYGGTRYLALSGSEKYDAIYDKIRYLINITYIISHNYARNKTDSYDSLTLHNVIILINSVFDKYQNHYYNNIFLEKCSYK